MRPAPPTPNFLELEAKILDFWKESRAFEKLRELRKDAPRFKSLDGPITANNPMGVHHAWGRTLKDAFIRYKAMKGFSNKYQNGFDCQGLWVEVEVEKALGFSGKPDIEKFGLDNFSRKCRERVETFSKVQIEQSVRLGQWMDWPDSYYTMSDGNMLGIWAFLKKCHENGWLKKKGLPMPWCWRCGTSLSEHEMAGSHQDVEHLSVFVQAPLSDDPGRRLLLWTTTPWTLAANTAAAVNTSLTYCEVSLPDLPHRLILCQDALPALKDFNPRVEKTFPGRELVGKTFETFFPDLPAQAGVEHRVVAWDQVDAKEGSGIVHIAPGCGREDHDLGQKEKLPSLSPVDENGRYVDGYGWLTGRHVSEVAGPIVTALKESAKLLKAKKHKHSYPVCWRCKSELIFRLVEEWFIDCDGIRPRMIEAARSVEWTPDFMGKRMEDWLKNMGDWCISRKRYWGLALPFYPCGKCGRLTVAGSKEELKKLALEPAKVDALPELHRPWIDDVLIRCPGCSEAVRRVPEVGDCWLDAGIVPYSALGYFDDRAAWEKNFPADWVCEMREQVRLWFYSMLFMGVTLSNRAPYKKVLTHERVVAETGAKFSKTGYMIRFDEAVEKMGADVMRYLYCAQPVDLDMRFGYGLADVAARKLGALWNVYAFFTLYASVDNPAVAADAPGPLSLMDRWLLARTHAMLKETEAAYEAFDASRAIREMEKYLEEVSNWYIRLNRRRFWKSGDPADKAACYNALHAGLRSAALALAPVTPFLAEEIWQNAVRPLLPEAAESIHHARWPEPPAAWRDEGLLQRAETVRKTITLALRLREKAKLRVRQPLAALYVRSDGAARQALQEQSSLLQSELNVKEVKFLEAGQASPEGFPSDAEGGLAVALDTTLTDALRREGLARDLVRKLQILRKESGLSITQRIELGLSTEDAELKKAIQDHRDHIMEELLAVRLEDRPLSNGAARQDLVLAGAALSATLRPAAQPS